MILNSYQRENLATPPKTRFEVSKTVKVFLLNKIFRKTRRRSFSSTVPKYARFLTGACFVFGFVLYREARVYRMQRREMADEGL